MLIQIETLQANVGLRQHHRPMRRDVVETGSVFQACCPDDDISQRAQHRFREILIWSVWPRSDDGFIGRKKTLRKAGAALVIHELLVTTWNYRHQTILLQEHTVFPADTMTDLFHSHQSCQLFQKQNIQQCFPFTHSKKHVQLSIAVIINIYRHEIIGFHGFYIK